MFQREITKEEVDKLAPIQYEGPITVIESMEAFRGEIGHMASCPVLGFDTETRPSFRKGKVYPTSLIQLASDDHAWLIRVSRLGYPGRLLRLLSSAEVLKVGVGLNDDLRKMLFDHRFEPGGFLDLQRYVEAFQIGEKGLKKMVAIVLGRRISKSQQVSNWDADQLTEAQLRYAATDAWICLRIYSSLRQTLGNPHG